MLDFIAFISKGRVRGDSKLESRADIFKMISRHELVDTHRPPTENIYRVFSKILRPVCVRVCCHQQPDTNELEEPTEVKIRAFN